MKSLGLSTRAAGSLDDIAAYSRETYGRLRGDAYVSALLERCKNVANGQLAGRSCRSQFGTDILEDLRYIPAGKHFVIYVESATAIQIVDFIHQSADIGGRLGGRET